MEATGEKIENEKRINDSSKKRTGEPHEFEIQKIC